MASPTAEALRLGQVAVAAASEQQPAVSRLSAPPGGSGPEAMEAEEEVVASDRGGRGGAGEDGDKTPEGLRDTSSDSEVGGRGVRAGAPAVIVR